MPRYAFKALDKTGQTKKGEHDSANENMLCAALAREGLSLVACRPMAPRHRFSFTSALPLPEQALFCRHMLAMVKAGVPVHTALGDMLVDPEKTPMNAALKTVHQAIVGGASLSAAFKAQGKQFDVMFPLLLQAGEQTGRLAEALGFLEESLRWTYEDQKKLRAALTYPFLQIILAGGAVTVLMLVAVPQIVELLKTIGQSLPWYSTALLWFMKITGGLLAVGAVSLIFGFLALPFLRVIPGMAIMLDRILLRLPILGGLLTKLTLAQVAQLFAAMLASGVSAVDALKNLPELTKNKALAADLEVIAQDIAGGRMLSQAFGQHKTVPAYVQRLLKIGEDSGRLPESLRHIAAAYTASAQDTLNKLLKIMTLFITCAVGLVLIAVIVGVLFPLYSGLNLLVAS